MTERTSRELHGIYLDVLQRYLIPWSDVFAREHIHPTGDGRYLIDQEGAVEIRAAVDRVIDAMDSAVAAWFPALRQRQSILPPGHGARYHGSRVRR